MATPVAEGRALTRTRTRLGRKVNKKSERRAFIIGGAIVGAYILAALLAPVIAPFDPNKQDLFNALQAPGGEHLLGTDSVGRDTFSRLIYAGRVDLPVAVIAALLPFIIGTVIGSVAGYAGGVGDSILMRIADSVQAFPIYVLLLVLVFAFGQGATSFILAATLVSWVAYARLIRGEIIRAKQLPYVMAAKTAGLPHSRIIVRHILPNTIGRSIVYAMSDIVLLILALASLSFLGVGIPAPTAEWGRMIAESQIYLRSHWWLLVAPGLAIVVLGIGLSFLGDALDQRTRR
ncbi:MAG: peptide/nickel transport system permease protein [Actinomycetota bacterium]|jgi:peptide/nickel transport system permease protein|nr:peptide/nickel transport system permease protein [Actinomycetota bacterium]